VPTSFGGGGGDDSLMSTCWIIALRRWMLCEKMQRDSTTRHDERSYLACLVRAINFSVAVPGCIHSCDQVCPAR
jgi:hypothetical protein